MLTEAVRSLAAEAGCTGRSAPPLPVGAGVQAPPALGFAAQESSWSSACCPNGSPRCSLALTLGTCHAVYKPQGPPPALRGILV